MWLVLDQKELTTSALKAIQKHAGGLFISSISIFEVTTKYQKGLIKFPMHPSKWFDEALELHGVSDLPIDHKIALRSALLPAIHKDPADRIIVATAQEHNLKIITPDRHIHAYSVDIIW